jgi:hypothetical protein
LREAFRDAKPRVGKPAWLGWILLGLPPALSFRLGLLESRPQAALAVVLLTVPFALVNGTLVAVL